MIRVFVIATTPMQQAGLHAMLPSSDIEIVGESLVPDIAREELSESDVVVIADEVLLEDAVRMMPRDEMSALVVMANNEQKAFSLLRDLRIQSWGIVPATVSALYLQATVISVAQGSVTFPNTLLSQSLREEPLHVQSVHEEDSDEVLTMREREVLELVSQGLSNKLIARHLQISEHTVKFHISSVSAKLGAASRTDAVRLGLRKGLITL